MGYFFHPLGEEAINYSRDSYYSYYEHGVECVDIGVSSGTPIYSMTSGEVIIAEEGSPNNGFNRYGGIVVIKANSGYSNYTGEDHYILYSHLQGFTVNNGDTVSAGTQIGISGGANGDPMQGSSTGAHLHLEFRSEIASRTKAGTGLLYNKTDHISDWGNIKDWSLARNIDGTYPIKIGNSYSYCHATCCQEAEYLTGGGDLNPTVDVPSEYLTYVFSDRFMGAYPDNIANIRDDKYRAIRILARAAANEFGYGNEGMSYSKLFRAWILYHFAHSSYNFRAKGATLETFANAWVAWVTSWGYDSSDFHNVPSDISEEAFFEFTQNIYKNISQPGIFGLNPELDNYNEAMTACSNMPFANETSGEGTKVPVTHGNKLIFSVISPFQGWGWYVLFRFENSLSSVNNVAIT
ncbi:MAG: M23 family metallopeptidase [Methanobrevibacter sp.]